MNMPQVLCGIFQWAIEGLSPGSIASRLDQLGVLSPMEYKNRKGANTKPSSKLELGQSGVMLRYAGSCKTRFIPARWYRERERLRTIKPKICL